MGGQASPRRARHQREGRPLNEHHHDIGTTTNASFRNPPGGSSGGHAAVWKRRVQEAVRVKQPEDADRIAENCAVAEWFGDYYPAVLHEAAKFYGTECHCYECTRRRELNRA